MEISVIFYKSGYVQLQVADNGDDFCHIYDNPDHLAKDVSQLLTGGNAIGWYGNDPEAWVDPESAEGIRFIKAQELPDYLAAFKNGRVDLNLLWENEIVFYKALIEKLVMV